MTMIYKVSYIVRGGEHPGSIRNEEDRPKIGGTVNIGPDVFEIVEVNEIMPPRDGFQYLTVVVSADGEEQASESYW